MLWINVKTQLPVDGQEVYYFSPILGLWRGKYKYSPPTHTVDEEGNQHPVSEKLAALVSPHVFVGGGGCCDTDEVTHWKPYDEETKKHEEQGWIPLPPMYSPPELDELRAFHDEDEEVALHELAEKAKTARQQVVEGIAAFLAKHESPETTVDAQTASAASDTAWLDESPRLVVDPSEGWRYGFPKVWDKVQHPNLTQWLIDNGYPENLAVLGRPMRFMSVS